jgi:hypothetical protein
MKMRYTFIYNILFTASDYPFGIFKLFCLSSIYSLTETVNRRKTEEFEDTKRVIRNCK